MAFSLARVAGVARSALQTRVRQFAAQAVSDGTKIILTFSSPHQAHYAQAAVAQVNIPSSNGDFGVLPNHVPALGVLKPGVVSVFETADAKKDFFVSSGTITVNQDSSVQILAEEAFPLNQLDVSLAKSGLDKANAAFGSAKNDVERAEAEIAVEVYTALVRALESSH